MSQLNDGLLYTTDKCIGCNKCIAQCSILGANVSVIKDGVAKIKIDSAKCNHCGKCIALCIHGAREYKDDTADFLKSIADGEKYSLLVAPSFYILYPQQADQILGYLKANGIEKIYDVAFGSEISGWAHVKYLKDNENVPAKDKAFITHTCPAFINAVEMYQPQLLSKIIPVQTPMMCTAIYARKYLGDNNNFVFLGPCISKKDEIQSDNTFGIVRYNCTFEHLVPEILKNDISSYSAESDLKNCSTGDLVPAIGEFKTYIMNFFPRNEFMMDFRGLEPSLYQFLNMSLKEDGTAVQPFLADVLACKNGCLEGPGTEKDVEQSKIYSAYFKKFEKAKFETKIMSAEERWQLLCERFKDLNAEDFSRNFVSRYRQPFNIPESTYDDIFNSMLKTTEEKRNMNCNSCGYRSCREMATAIAYGYNKKENCIHYMNDVMEKNYYMDEETGLLNRNAFLKEANLMVKKNPRLQYVMCSGDINRFRVINDLYGFNFGNKVLKTVAEQLKKIMPKGSLIARLDGGNFAIFFEYNADVVHLLYDFKFFDTSVLQIKVPLTMRFGLYILRDSSEELNEALNCATLSMDKASSYSQNTYNLFTREYKEIMIMESRLTSLMQPALDNNEFKVWYQPQYDSMTGELVGAESLCRWIQTDGNLISPSVFIPLAEKNGFIRSLDKAIWRMVFMSVRKWLDEGIKMVPISINVSRINLTSDAIIYVIKNLENEFNVPPELIHFEITESAFASDQEKVIERINKIRNMGYRIAMDDFGSGYSSLNTLKDIPIDILKLDMGFIRNGTNMDKGGSIISNVTRMAQNLEYVTVAEGVETEEQAVFLRGIGANIIQGFLYSSPVCEEEFVELLKKGVGKSFVSRIETKGRIDVSRFYDPSSAESLMFEEFTGASAILEYDYIKDNTVVIRCNEKCYKMFGLNESKLSSANKTLKKYLRKPDGKKYALAIIDAISKAEEIICLTEHKNFKTKYPLWVKSHTTEISRQGSKHILYVLLEDVTAEIKKEKKLEVSNKQMELMVENTHIALCLMKLNLDWLNVSETIKIRIIKCNQQFIDSSGYSKEDVEAWTEKDALGVIHPKDRPGFIASAIKSFAGGFTKPFTYDYRGLEKNGNYSNIRITINGIKQEDGSYFLVTTYERI